MTQKDKVKELVGRGLHSYHTKALQQMDRIEKKNKEQNHKISILTNELDNDYLTKTEEGSVVSLEHSKEGMVYLDELQGNTLVNYCTDGSKEMTLNGDIDVEGTFVTTTEGVNNGKVDVMCEGNTLVNLIKYDAGHYYPTYTWEIGEVYTMIVEFTSSAECQLYIEEDITWAKLAPITNGVKVGYNKFVVKLTIPSNYTGLERINITNRVNNLYDSNVKFTDIKPIVLKGDWTNKETPQSYFESMKSVGQDDENGHKIEILSQNKNLLKNTSLSTKTDWCTFNGTIVEGVNDNKGIYSEYIQTTSSYYDFLQQDIFSNDNVNNTIKNDKWYTFSFYAKGTGKVRTHIYPRVIDDSIKGFVDGVEKPLLSDGNCDWILTNEWVRHSYTFKTKSSISDMGTYGKILFRLMPSNSDLLNTVTISCPMLEEEKVSTNFTNDSSNKKEILLNEPLVGNDTVKDRVVKIGGKSFIERFWETVTLDGTQEIVKGNWDVPIFSYYVPNTEGESTNFPNTLICDRIKPQSFNLNDNTHWALYTGKDSIETKRYIRIQIPTSIVVKDDLEGFKTWLRNNPVTIAYRLNTPIYEPLETDSTLNTYNDITHISNNSIIPCNMKIKNSGYNVIIKPSTLYTVALDTNKSGTIGMNLGGAKGTTTNNVLKLTTPATLTDDSLRLYGKGIKGSKARILEGDKTNWIPSHFEGMKSSFEDKFDDTDNTYKMEILSNNENLFDGEIEQGRWNYRIGGEFSKEKNNTGYRSKNIITLKPNTTYIIYGDFKGNGHIAMGTESNTITRTISMNIPNTITTSNKETMLAFYTVDVLGDEYIPSNIVIKKKTENIDYIPHKSNKIQFSSIEPLRGVDNIKDKFVFKDGKLMIERNCSKYTTVGTENWLRHDYSNSNKIFAYAHVTSMNDRKAYTNIYCNNFATYLKSAEELRKQNNEYIWKGNDSHPTLWLWISNNKFDGVSDINKFKTWIKNNPITVTYQLAEPTYEEIPFELQKIILEGYENGTLFFDTNIPPTSTITYAGETPIVKSVKLNKTEVLNNTNDINDNIVPYLMDMDYRVVCLQLQTENINDGVSMARLFGGIYEMLQRDIKSKRYSIDEYRYRLDAYLSANKITNEEYEKLGDMLNE